MLVVKEPGRLTSGAPPTGAANKHNDDKSHLAVKKSNATRLERRRAGPARHSRAEPASSGRPLLWARCSCGSCGPLGRLGRLCVGLARPCQASGCGAQRVPIESRGARRQHPGRPNQADWWRARARIYTPAKRGAPHLYIGAGKAAGLAPGSGVRRHHASPMAPGPAPAFDIICDGRGRARAGRRTCVAHTIGWPPGRLGACGRPAGCGRRPADVAPRARRALGFGPPATGRAGGRARRR